MRVRFAGAALLLALSTPLLAQDAPPPEAPAEDPKPADAAPADADPAAEDLQPATAEEIAAGKFDRSPGNLSAPEGSDWVQLTSGEWMHGDFKGMRDEVFTFDSSILEILNIDLGDVGGFASPRQYTYSFGSPRDLDSLEEVVGSGRMVNGKVFVTKKDGSVVVFPRGQLLSIVTSGGSELDYWNLKVNLSLTGTTGNTEQLTGTMRVDLKREDAYTLWRGAYLLTYGSVDDEETAKIHQGATQLDVFLSRMLYLVPFSGRVLYDRFQNIDLRASAGAGLGYYFVRDPGLKFSTEINGSYTYWEFRSAPPGETRFDSQPQVKFTARLDWDITEDVEFDGLYEFYLGVEDLSQSYHHAEAYLYIDLIGDDLKLSLSFIWDRQEDVARRSDGTLPHKDDIRYSIGLVVDL